MTFPRLLDEEAFVRDLSHPRSTALLHFPVYHFCPSGCKLALRVLLALFLVFFPPDLCIS